MLPYPIYIPYIHCTLYAMPYYTTFVLICMYMYIISHEADYLLAMRAY